MRLRDEIYFAVLSQILQTGIESKKSLLGDAGNNNQGSTGLTIPFIRVLTIQCPKDCSFTSGRSKITFQSERKFDLFRGAENHVEIRNAPVATGQVHRDA